VAGGGQQVGSVDVLKNTLSHLGPSNCLYISDDSYSGYLLVINSTTFLKALVCALSLSDEQALIEGISYLPVLFSEDQFLAYRKADALMRSLYV
jgi:hypothetical protein